MRIALRELHRRPGRFVVAAAILTLIAILLMFLGGLADGLNKGNTGALRAQRADLIVFSATAKDSLVRSRIDPGVRRRIATAPGVSRVGGLGSLQVGARVPGHGPDFWRLVQRYPRTERARGYLDGITAAAQLPIADDLTDDVGEFYSDEVS